MITLLPVTHPCSCLLSTHICKEASFSFLERPLQIRLAGPPERTPRTPSYPNYPRKSSQAALRARAFTLSASAHPSQHLATRAHVSAEDSILSISLNVLFVLKIRCTHPFFLCSPLVASSFSLSLYLSGGKMRP